MGRAGADPYVPGHGDRRYAVTHYDLDLDYKVATNHLTGWARLGIEPTDAAAGVREIVLDLHALHVSRVTVDGRAVRGAKATRGRLTVPLPAPLAAPLTVGVVYAGKPRPMPGPDGTAGWEELTDGVLVGSQPHGAPSWFPCNDRPDDKATYRISIGVEAAYHVAGNGVLTGRTTRSGRTRWTHEQREPMPAYLACVQIGRYAVTPLAAAVPVELVAPPGTLVAGSAFERQGEMLDVMSRWFGPYPFACYRAVVAADRFEIPLEATGLASFGANHLRPVWDNERLVAHELAHSWFGNSVTAAAWSHIWLHEGFACYAEWLWSEHRGLGTAHEHAGTHWKRLKQLPKDLVLGEPGAAMMFDDRVYKRGALTLHALRSLLGTERFLGMLRAWTTEHAGGVVTTAGLAALLERVAGEQAPAAGELLRAWVWETPLPPLPPAPVDPLPPETHPNGQVQGPRRHLTP